MSLDAMNNILVVDDDQLIRNLLYALLSESGYAVKLAENGRDGLKKIEENGYDLIISDVNMPVMNGLAFYSAVREHYPGLEKKFIFLTSSQTKETMAFFADNDCRYLTKPFKPVDLLGEVAKILTTPPIRHEERFEWSVYCQLSADGQSDPTSVMLVAKTLDISHHGAKIRYFGRPLAAGKRANIYLRELDLKRDVTIVWSKRLNESVISGLMSTEDITVPLLKKGITVQPRISF